MDTQLPFNECIDNAEQTLNEHMMTDKHIMINKHDDE